MRPLVLLDVDGVLANIVASVLDFVHECGGKRYREDHIVNYDILACLPEPAHIKKAAWSRLKEPGACVRMQPFLDSFEGVRQLREIADVHIVTTPLDGAVTWMPERVEWLKTHYGFGLSDITFTHRKDLIDGQFLIDDKPENAARIGGLLWDASYNRRVPHRARVSNWDQVLRIVKQWHT